MFEANKYNPDNDPHYPKIGENLMNENKIITKVQHITSVDLMKLFMSEDQPEDVDHLTVVNNPDRPFLKYLVWWK